MKNAIFGISKKFLGPVHLHPKTDKWDYLRSPIMKKNFVSCFDIREVPRSPGKWNWNWLYFLPFIFTFKQGDMAILDIFMTLGPRRGRPEKEMSIIFFSTKCILIVTMKAPTKQSPPKWP